MENEKIVTINFVLHNGFNITQYGYKLSDAKAIAHRFNVAKNSPEKSTVMSYESPEDSSKGLTIDLKNILGVFYQ